MGLETGILGAASLASTAAGTYAQSGAIRGQASYEAQQLNANARLANLQAARSEQLGQRAATRQMQATRGLIGSQRASLAAQGIDISSGSAADIQADTAALGALDAQMLANNARLEAMGYRQQASSLQGQARMTKLGARNAARNTILSGGLQATRDLGYLSYLNSQRPGTKTPTTYSKADMWGES